jgi:hypothetical protein
MSLITNISQLRAASSISISNTLANWQPYISEAEETFILPVVGEDLYQEMEDAANGSGSSVSTYEDLLTKTRKALALYALCLGTDEMVLSVSAAGIQRVVSDTHKPASEFEILNLKESWMQRAHRQIDLMLKYLDEHRETFPSYVPVDHDLLITNAADFTKYVDINASRRVFLMFKPIMASVEKKYIRPTLSSEYYDELKAAIGGSSALSDDDQAVVDLVKPALAHLTMVRALQEITTDILNWGAFVHSWSTFKSMRRMDDANKERVSAMLEANQRDADAELKELQEYLDNNASATKYAAYFNSSRYVGPSAAVKRNDFTNSAEKSFFCP